jgi:hypothetical protein
LLIPVILATWEAEIQKIEIQDQPRQKANKTPPSQPIAGSNGVCLSSQTTWEAEIRRITIPGQSGQKSLQNPVLKEKG